MSTFEKDRKIVDLATKAAMAFRILRITQRDLEAITAPEGFAINLKNYQEGRGEDPKDIRRARIKANDAADNEFWDAMRELDKAVG